MSSIGIGSMSPTPDCPCMGGTLDKLIQPAILSVLSYGPLHGYMLAERIGKMTSESAEKPDLSGIYRFLKTMEKRGLVVSSWDTPRRGTLVSCFTSPTTAWRAWSSGPRRWKHTTPPSRSCFDRSVRRLRASGEAGYLPRTRVLFALTPSEDDNRSMRVVGVQLLLTKR